MVEVDYRLYIDIASVIVETVIVVLLIKTVKDYAEVAKASRLQIKQRFRPWIGPTSGIDFLRESDGKHQFAVAIKNFGEIPATNVVASSTARNELPTRSLADKKDGNREQENIDRFVLGPLLPNMEKRYWIFIDSEKLHRAKQGTAQLYTFINFYYEFDGGTSSYGMISQYDPKANVFIHKDMWVG